MFIGPKELVNGPDESYAPTMAVPPITRRDAPMKPFRMLAAAALIAFAGSALADAYPAKPIKMIVPFPPGGGTDILARTVSNYLGSANKWTVVVDNRAGAGGNIGVDAAAKSAPDGYTLVMGQTSNLAISPSLYSKLNYDPVKDL